MLLTILLTISVLSSFLGSLYLLFLGLKSGTLASRQFALFLFLFSAMIVCVYTVTDPQNMIPIHIQNLFSLLFYVIILAIPPTLYNFNLLHFNLDQNAHRLVYSVALFLFGINSISFVYLTFSNDLDSYLINLVSEVMNYSNFIAYLFIFPILTIYYLFRCFKVLKWAVTKSNERSESKKNIIEAGLITFGYGIFLLLFISMQLFGGSFVVLMLKGYLVVYSLLLLIQGYYLKRSQENTSSASVDQSVKPLYFEEVQNRLELVISEQKPYLDPKLTLYQLAKMADTNEKYLSAFLNETRNLNFSGFINELRISHAKTLLLDPNNDYYTIETIGNMAGFHSKSSFNSAFKRSTGKTPSEFKKA